ncbi:MAG: HipA N-terminal domain-containing protein [Eubacteriales bacterium]|nr:HipA N-terminal domain-containing protein [Eubacteriales bacterium]
MLCETDEGYTFQYDQQYMQSDNHAAVSLTLPLSKQVYRSNTMFPFFDGLIPEGWLLNVVSRNWKIHMQDRFGLLLAACKDPIGIVSIREEKI